MKSMTKREIVETADYIGADREWALQRRVQYLLNKKHSYEEYIETARDMLKEEDNAVTKAFVGIVESTTFGKIKRINREIKNLTLQPKKGRITEDMIAVARDTPVEQLIDFGRHDRCHAFCHDSDSDSMVKSRNGNYAWCNRCNKSFSAIDILIERDGFSFVDAVKQLAGDLS